MSAVATVKAGLRSAATRLATSAARAYIAGEELDDGLEVCRRLAGRGFASALGYWNDVGEPVEDVLVEYLAALTRAAEVAPVPYLSIKAPALGLRRDLVEEVAERAAETVPRLHFDAHGPETVDPTWTLVRAAAAFHRDVGCTLPGRWARSDRDALAAADAGCAVRVVKGQWADPAGERDPVAGFLEVVRRLAGRARHVAVASHDPAVAVPALERLLAAGTPCELELLYGLPRRQVLAAVAHLSVGVRLYVPYGAAFLPYTLAYVRTNPRVAWWLAWDAARGVVEALAPRSRSASATLGEWRSPPARS